jgi:hypothetical protein
VLPFLSLGGYLLWYEMFQADSPRYCDAPMPVGLGPVLFMGPVVEVIRVADRRRVTGRAALLAWRPESSPQSWSLPLPLTSMGDIAGRDARRGGIAR